MMLRFIAEAILQRHYFRGRFFLLRLLIPRLRYVRARYGVVMKVVPDDLTNIYCITGVYSDVVRNVVNALAPDRVFVDIGANHGLFSLLASQRLTEGLVFSFEPSPRVYRFLLANILANGATNIVPVNAAVGGENALMRLSFDPKHSGVSNLSGTIEGKESGGSSMVPVLDISRFDFVAEQIGSRGVCVKIDVEGYELRVLRALLRAPYAHQIETVVVEVDAANLARFSDTVSDLYALMAGAGFAYKFGAEWEPHYDEVFTRPSRVS